MRPAVVLASLALALFASACTSESDDTAPATTRDDDEAADASTDSADDGAEPVALVVTDGSTGYSNEADYLGNPIWATGPGNIGVAADNQVAIRFVARHDGVLERASFIVKYDFERPGYHGGDCGVLEVTLRPDAVGVPSEEVLGRLTLDDPCGGQRDIGWLTDESWDEPIPVTGGDTYHLVFTNLDPDPANYVSVNMLYRPADAGDALDASTGDGRLRLTARGNAYWSGNDTDDWGASLVLADHYPAFELHYGDGSRQGVSYVGARFEQEITLAPGSSRIRQVFTPGRDTTITSARFRGVESAPGTRLGLVLSEKDGASLYTGELVAPTDGAWFGGPLPTPLTLIAGSTYTAEIVATAGSVVVRPLYQAAHDDWISAEESDWDGAFVEVATADTWAPYVNEIPHDLSLYFDRQPRASGSLTATVDRTGGAAGAVDPLRIAVYGDSLLGQADFDAALAPALTARSLTFAGKDTDPGRTARGLLEAIASDPLLADVYVINIGINGGETVEEFRATAEEAIDAIRALDPEAVILWSSIHALPIQVTYIVDERVDPRNAVLESLAAEGRIVLVPWAETAAANQWIYGTDGVHYFGNERVYVQTLLEGLDRWLATSSR